MAKTEGVSAQQQQMLNETAQQQAQNMAFQHAMTKLQNEKANNDMYLSMKTEAMKNNKQIIENIIKNSAQ